MTTLVHFTRIRPGAIAPMRAYNDDAGWDLSVCETRHIEPNQGADIATGIAVSIPPGFYGRLIGRSSTLRKRGLLIVEGIIDAGYHGELFSFAFNISGELVSVSIGERLCQLIVSPIPTTLEIVEAYLLPPSDRGDQGFGSSGGFKLPTVETQAIRPPQHVPPATPTPDVQPIVYEAPTLSDSFWFCCPTCGLYFESYGALEEHQERDEHAPGAHIKEKPLKR